MQCLLVRLLVCYMKEKRSSRHDNLFGPDTRSKGAKGTSEETEPREEQVLSLGIMITGEEGQKVT